MGKYILNQNGSLLQNLDVNNIKRDGECILVMCEISKQIIKVGEYSKLERTMEVFREIVDWLEYDTVGGIVNQYGEIVTRGTKKSNVFKMPVD